MLDFKHSIFILCLIVVGACSTEPQQKTKPVTKPKVKIEVPTFNSDSAYSYIQKQVDFGPRVS